TPDRGTAGRACRQCAHGGGAAGRGGARGAGETERGGGAGGGEVTVARGGEVEIATPGSASLAMTSAAAGSALTNEVSPRARRSERRRVRSHDRGSLGRLPLPRRRRVGACLWPSPRCARHRRALPLRGARARH